MATIATWDIRDEGDDVARFDGRSTYAELRPETDLLAPRGGISFTFCEEVRSDAATLLSLVDEERQGLRIALSGRGVLSVEHYSSAARAEARSPAGFYSSGDTVAVEYRWDSEGGGRLRLVNLTRLGADLGQAIFRAPIADAVSFARSDNAVLYIGARPGAEGYSEFFRGTIDRLRWSAGAEIVKPLRRAFVQASPAAGQDDFDILDLGGHGPVRIEYDNASQSDGLVEFLDDFGKVTGSLRFRDIQNIVPCFTPGTMIATPEGERPVETLRAGDRVLTRDNGVQRVVWAGGRTLDWTVLRRNRHLQPILIRKGALGRGMPERDMQLSPNHRVLVANDATSDLFCDREVLATARQLTSRRGVHEVQAIGVTYVHLMFERHEIVLANGAWMESFHPNAFSMRGVGARARAEIVTLLPALKTIRGMSAYAPARKLLHQTDAGFLAD